MQLTGFILAKKIALFLSFIYILLSIPIHFISTIELIGEGHGST